MLMRKKKVAPRGRTGVIIKQKKVILDRLRIASREESRAPIKEGVKLGEGGHKSFNFPEIWSEVKFKKKEKDPTSTWRGKEGSPTL